jgi:hypothetical protein
MRAGVCMAVAALAACSGATGTGWPAAGGDESTIVLARTPDAVVTAADLRDLLARLAKASTPHTAREVLDRAIDVRLLAAEARRRGYAERLDVAWQLENVLAAAMTKEDTERVRAEIAAITDEAAHAYYRAHQLEFSRPFDDVQSEVRRAMGRDRLRAAKDALLVELRREVVLDDAAVASVLADPTLVSVAAEAAR